MYRIYTVLGILMMMLSIPIYSDASGEIGFDDYLKKFDSKERREMKIRIPELLSLYKQDKVQIIDIRTLEEYEAYHLNFMKHIPINEIPEKLGELDKSKIIVTVCTNYDRAEMVRIYLALKGFRSRYLVDGMIGLHEYLTRGYGKEFYEKQEN
jgi:rhodanese-related sulfurtransferase